MSLEAKLFRAQPQVIYNGEVPQRNKDRILVVDHAPVVDYFYSASLWARMNEAIDNTLDRSDYQVLVLTPHRDDVTPLFFKNLSKSPLGPHPIASTADQKFPDTEPNIRFKNDSPSVQSLYVVSSVVSPEDYLYLLEKIDYYRQTLNVKCVTGIFPYLLSTRQDKNVDKNGNLVATPINIRAILGGLSPFVDRIVVFEPHSSATQAYAAEWGIPLAPLSPWQFMYDELCLRGVIVKRSDGKEERIKVSPENSVIIRPDKGRNIAATRISKYSGISSVSFNKARLSGSDVSIYDLTAEEQALVKDKIALMYDDEASTMGTINEIANALKKYGAKALAACLIHCKFTPGWEEKIQHSLLTTVLATDSREPVGNIRMTDKIEVVSLEGLIRQVIEADVRGVNYWTDPNFSSMILQPNGDEV